jgi:hypothetical protein
MADATFLHIQTRDAHQPRVMELAGSAVRIGRGAQCEVQLSEASLADVQCLLRRRGASWHLQPIGPPGKVSIDGRTVEHARVLPLGTTIRIGRYWLTLRPAGAAPTGFGSYEAPIPVEPRAVHETPILSSRGDAGDEAEARLARWRATQAQREHWLKARREERRWTARWRAYGEELRARATAETTPNQEPPLGWVEQGEGPAQPTIASQREERSPENACDNALVGWVEPSRPNTTSDSSGNPPEVVVGLEDSTHPTEIETKLPEPIGADSEVVVGLEDSTHPTETEPESLRGPEVEPPTPTSGETFAPVAPPVAVTTDDDRLPESEWPSVRAILQAHAARALPRPSSSKPRRPASLRPEPSEAIAPASWTLPGWMALFPTGALVLLVGLVLVRVSWTWSQDDYAAGVVANRLLRAEPIPDGPFELPEAPNPSWWASTPEHLHLRALALSRGELDAAKADEVRFLLSTAKHAAPLDPSVRLALAQNETTPALGLSRDFVALRKTAQGLLAAGKTAPALKVDREALEIAARVDLARAPLPEFLEDSQVRRFRLPHEEAMEPIVQDLAGQRGWRFADWSGALPPDGLAALVAYRLLREAGDPEAGAARALVLGAEPDPANPTRAALVLAAQGEALALAERWAEAAARYREAIALVPNDLIRRTWWLNLGEIAGRQGDLDLMRTACNAARGPSPKDEVNTRMVTARARYGLDGLVKKPTAKDGPAKSNPPR